MERERLERELRLIETEINLWRTPWQSQETPIDEKSKILHHVMDLIKREKEIKDILK